MSTDSEVLSLLRTKLAHIDQDCEDETRASVVGLQSEVRYDGGRLRVPDFQKAANVLVSVIPCKEKRFNAEISRVFSVSSARLRPEELERATGLVAQYLRPESYLKRFDGFVEGVARSASRYGLAFNPQAYSVDLAEALFVAGVENTTRRALASINAELALHVVKQPPAPNIGETPGINDIVDLKPNFMGIGINLNALMKKYWARIKARKPN